MMALDSGKFEMAKLMDEDQWLDELEDRITQPLSLTLDCAHLKRWGFNTPQVTVQVLPTDTVEKMIKKLKEENNIEIPANKLKIKHKTLSVLRTFRTMGYYNMTETAGLSLLRKQRGSFKRKRNNGAQAVMA